MVLIFRKNPESKPIKEKFVLNTVKSTNLHNNWNSIDWNIIYNYVVDLQQRIFLAEKNNNKKKVKQLQKILINSKANLLLSIKENAQTYSNIRSAGIDNCKLLTDNEAWSLYQSLLTYNIKKIRPLKLFNKYQQNESINLLKDKIWQTVITRALVPQWEVHFDVNSYAYRPGRNFRDAISSIFNKVGVRKKRQFLLKLTLDVSNINIDFLNHILSDFEYKDIILNWINNDYMKYYFHNQHIYGLIINMLLCGLENRLNIKYKKSHVQISNTPSIVNYGTELMIICHSELEAQDALNQIKLFLQLRGINIIKTDLAHIESGIDFLGFNIRLYQASKDKNNHKQKLLIKPAQNEIQSLKDKFKEIFHKYRGQNIGFILNQINPLIREYAYKWRFVVASPAYKTMDNYIAYKIYHHLKRLHPKKSWKWIKNTYYKPCKKNSNSSHICDPQNSTNRIFYFRDVSIKRHVLVTFNYSVFDKSLKDYWYKHNKVLYNLMHGEFKIRLAQRQKYICPHCKQMIYEKEGLELNHILPQKYGSKFIYRNLQLMHISCHIKHHQLYKTYDDYNQYVKEQQQWYDELWN